MRPLVVLPRKFALLALSLIEDVVLHPEDFIGHCKAENRPPPRVFSVFPLSLLRSLYLPFVPPPLSFWIEQTS